MSSNNEKLTERIDKMSSWNFMAYVIMSGCFLVSLAALLVLVGGESCLQR